LEPFSYVVASTAVSRWRTNRVVKAASGIASGAPKRQVAPAAVTKRRNPIAVKSLLTQTGYDGYIPSAGLEHNKTQITISVGIP
jgi:hypothetical protein